uniref:Uncharacterized protein n=1 Tax=Cacopsylla melanoneura TaxID=428564 RepID=A0A8D8LBJ5_9HEMI
MTDTYLNKKGDFLERSLNWQVLSFFCVYPAVTCCVFSSAIFSFSVLTPRPVYSTSNYSRIRIRLFYSTPHYSRIRLFYSTSHYSRIRLFTSVHPYFPNVSSTLFCSHLSDYNEHKLSQWC